MVKCRNKKLCSIPTKSASGSNVCRPAINLTNITTSFIKLNLSVIICKSNGAEVLVYLGGRGRCAMSLSILALTAEQKISCLSIYVSLSQILGKLVVIFSFSSRQSRVHFHFWSCQRHYKRYLQFPFLPLCTKSIV